MPQLVFSQQQFDQEKLDAWKKGQREALISMAGSDHLRGVLTVKASSRKKLTTRFFGETYLASINPKSEGFYGSFKWLTNPRFATTKPFPKGPAQTFQHKLRDALHQHFTQDGVASLQRAAWQLYRANAAALNDKKPTAPDLWLIEKEHHRFIEAKLPGDSLAPHQLAGLAVLASCLGDRHSVSVEVVDLRPRCEELFATLCRHIAIGHHSGKADVELRIVWTEDDSLSPLAGHGIDFFAGDSDDPARLVAVVRGFEWLHDTPETVEVHIRPEGDDMATLKTVRPAIERYLRSREVVDGQVTPTLYAHING